MALNEQTAPSDRVTICVSGRASGVDERHYSLVIVSSARAETVELESLLETATRRGLDKIARVLRQQIVERDEQILENAMGATDRDFALSGALVQFAVQQGVLRCRAFVESEKEDELIEALGRIPGVHTIKLEIVLPSEGAQA